MKRQKTLPVFIVIMVVASLVSCVPLKQYTEIKSDAEKYKDDNQIIKEENEELVVKVKELEADLAQAQMKLIELKQRLDELSNGKSKDKQHQEQLEKANADLEQQIKALKDGSSDEISKLLEELQTLQTSLQDREDNVRLSEAKLLEQQEKSNNIQKELADRENQLTTAKETLAEQQKELQKLQEALDKQKESVQALRQSLLTALKGYDEQELKIHEKNGKVYVSMDEKLLFKSGSYELGENGRAALKSLGEVLAAKPEINILIEGHTDDVPLNGSTAIKDNWDLSVMRATAVTKILLANSNISPERITAAGRSEYIPLELDKTQEARQKNRRTEIILTPDLSQVFDILKTN